MKKVNAVVVTYNRKKLLVESIESILNQSYCINKLIIVDNNSSDGTYEELVSLNYLTNKKIEYIKLDENIGGAGGFYTGIKKSYEIGCDWTWIMDDDTIPTINCLKELVKSIDVIEEEKISFLASSIYGEKREFMNVPSINANLSESGYPDWYKYLDKGIVKILEATFVSLLINNDAIKSVGLPVKDYFIWGDDTEYTLRLNKYYGPSFFVGNSIAIHKRKIAKNLTIIEEDNPTRLKFHYFMIRNNLINKKNYYGFFKMFIFLIRNQMESFRVLFSRKCKNRIKKFMTIHKGISSFVFKKYDYKAFKNRLNFNVKYKR
jgi:GT2 family glycosyltransferase